MKFVKSKKSTKSELRTAFMGRRIPSGLITVQKLKDAQKSASKEFSTFYKLYKKLIKLGFSKKRAFDLASSDPLLTRVYYAPPTPATPKGGRGYRTALKSFKGSLKAS